VRERSLDEFESIFEQAAIPVLSIENVELARVSAVVRGNQLDASILELAGYLAARFGGKVQVHWPAGTDADKALEDARRRGLSSADHPFASTAELVGQVSISRSQLVLTGIKGVRNLLREAPSGHSKKKIPDTFYLETDLDQLVQGAAPPVLLLREPIGEPADVFRKILHSLTGNFQQTQNFAYSFTLAETDATLLLLHTIDSDELADVRDALLVSPDIAEKSGDELLESMAHHGERFLKAVVAASRKRPFEVTYRLAVGDVVPTVSGELERGDYGLLVVGSHREGHSYLAASDYQLMHTVRDIPVLAL
jgi:hypothetical protein